MKLITKEQVIESLRKLDPNEQNETCIYGRIQPNGEIVPVCVVGHVVADLTPHLLERVVEFESRVHTVTPIKENYDADAVQFLSDVQRRADSTWPWGRALELALREL